MPPGTIGDWTVTTLTKFIKNILEKDPVTFVSSLTAEELRVVNKLTVEDEAAFTAASVIHVVGNTGEPAFEHSWAHYGAPYSKASFLKDATGFVHLMGAIASGTVGQSAFTLPPGFRPLVDVGPAAVISNGALGRVDVKADGTVTPVSPSASASVVLDNIIFKAAF